MKLRILTFTGLLTLCMATPVEAGVIIDFGLSGDESGSRSKWGNKSSYGSGYSKQNSCNCGFNGGGKYDRGKFFHNALI